MNKSPGNFIRRRVSGTTWLRRQFVVFHITLPTAAIAARATCIAKCSSSNLFAHKPSFKTNTDGLGCSSRILIRVLEVLSNLIYFSI